MYGNHPASTSELLGLQLQTGTGVRAHSLCVGQKETLESS